MVLSFHGFLLLSCGNNCMQSSWPQSAAGPIIASAVKAGFQVESVGDFTYLDCISPTAI